MALTLHVQCLLSLQQGNAEDIRKEREYGNEPNNRPCERNYIGLSNNETLI